MARIRSIKPDFFTSEVVASLPLSARLTFVGLWTYADDNGVAVDNPKLINAAIWPLEDDPRETLQRTSGDLASLSTAGLIVRYEAAGKRLLFIRSWDEHQRVSHPGKPRYPRPPAALVAGVSSANEELPRNSGESPEDVASPPEDFRPEQGAGSREGSREQGAKPSASDARETRSKTKRGTRIPDDFAVTPEMVAWGRENVPTVNGALETAKFVDYWRAKSGAGATKTDWVATWRNWMRNAADRYPAPGSNVVPLGGRRSTTDDRVAATLALAAELQEEQDRLAIGGAS